MPVLPIWWSQQPEVGVSLYLGGMAIQGLLSTVIDFPLSFWSDKSHPRIPYAVGLGLFALAFIAAACGGFSGFLVYLVLIGLAGALMSGADMVLLLDIAKDSFKAEIYELNRRFYLFTSGLFLVGVGLYLVSPILLFVVQALLLAAAGCLIATINVTSHQPAESQTDAHNVNLTGSWRISPTLSWGLAVVAITLASGEFESVNQLINRSLQIVVADVSIPGINELWTVAGVLVVTNLLSSLGLGTRARRMSEKYGLLATLTFLIAGALASLIFINSGQLLVILVGAVVMGITKGVYRPLFTTLAVQTLPASRWRARWLSITGILSGVVSSLVNVLIVVGEPETSEIITRMTVQMVCVLLPVVIILATKLRLSVPLIQEGPTDKYARRVVRLGADSPAWLELTYAPPADQIIPTAVETQTDSDLPHPRILRWDETRIECEFIDGIPLDAASPEHHGDLLNQHRVFNALQERRSRHVETLSPAVRTEYARECERLCSCPAVSHGDLHPGNILLTGESFVIVDWEHGGNSCRALDELALLTHPYLDIGREQRATFFKELVTAHHADCAIRTLTFEQTAKRVLAAKLSDIHGWADSKAKSRLLLAYTAAQKSL